MAYNIPKNNYTPNPIRTEVVQRLIDFYLNNFGGNYYNGVWVVGKTQGLCKENGKDRLFTIFTGNTGIDVIYPTNEELLEFERVWLESGYFVSFAYDKGEKCIAFTNYPYQEYNFRLIKAELKYYLE